MTAHPFAFHAAVPQRSVDRTPTCPVDRPQRLVVAMDHHFAKVGDEIYTEQAFGYEYWREYLEVFDDVQVFARVRRVEEVPAHHFRADGPRVAFVGVPDYRGPYQLLARLPRVMAKARQTARSDAAFILRSGNVADCLWLPLILHRKPYAREVQGLVGEAVREATTSTHPFVGPLLALFAEHLTRLQVRWAAATSYVSEACRTSYPNAKRDREFVFSSVRLDDSLITRPRLAAEFSGQPLRIISVGRLEPEKGHHVLVDAIDLVQRRAPGRVSLTIAGGGRELETLRRRVAAARLEGVVDLFGPVQYGPRLFDLLDAAEIFVLPSFTEGMPRALIEAMARGLPAIGSRVGGICELLADDQLVAPKSAESLATAILARIAQPQQLERESRRNFHWAVEHYSQRRMRQRKHAFWSAVGSDRRKCLAA